MTEISHSASNCSLADSIEQVDTPDTELDGIELIKEVNNEAVEIVAAPSIKIARNKSVKKQRDLTKEDYLIQNLNETHRGHQQSSPPSPPSIEAACTQMILDKNSNTAANGDEPEEVATRIEAADSPNTSITSIGSLKSPKKLNEKMSPGLAKRVSTTLNESSTIGLPDVNPKRLSSAKSSLATSTCSSSSSTNATITPVSSASSSSNTNSLHSSANMKIQNALERNMQKLNLNTGKHKKTKGENLSKEDIELFTSPTLTHNQHNGGYFTSDSLSSTPEHHATHNSNNSTYQPTLLDSRSSSQKHQQQFILSQQEQLQCYYVNNSNTAAAFQPHVSQLSGQLTSDMIVNMQKQNLIERSSNDREMTPDSIDNENENFCGGEVLMNSKPKGKSVNQVNSMQQMQQQRKKVIANNNRHNLLNPSQHMKMNSKQVPVNQPQRLASGNNRHQMQKTNSLNSKLTPGHLNILSNHRSNGETTVAGNAPSSTASCSSTSSSALSSPILNSNIENSQNVPTTNANGLKSKPNKQQHHQPIQQQFKLKQSIEENMLQVPAKSHKILQNSNRGLNTKTNTKSVHKQEFINEIPNYINTRASQESISNQINRSARSSASTEHFERKMKESASFTAPSSSSNAATASNRMQKSESSSFTENNKAMPVVEEGLSNDELDENDSYDEENEIDYDNDMHKEQVLIEYNLDYDEENEDDNNNEEEANCDQEDQDDQEEYEEVEDEDDYEDQDEEVEFHQKQQQQQQQSSGHHRATNQNQNSEILISKIKGSIPIARNNQQPIASNRKSTNRLTNPQTNSLYSKNSEKDYDTDEETNKLLENANEEQSHNKKQPDALKNHKHADAQIQESKSREINVRQIMDPDNQVLIEGVLFRARYLGSTQLVTDGNPTKLTRMLQAQEAVGRIKAPDGESQPSVEVDLFVSTEKIMVLNTDLQEIMMDHSLRSISYIADIGNLVVLMAKRRVIPNNNGSDDSCGIKKQVKMICHVFESDEAQIVAQSIGQAFQVAYMEYLKANGIEDMSIMKDLDYQEVLNQQEIMGDELLMFAKKECQKEVIIPKQKNEILGVVIVESGWGSMLPTVVVANMMPTGPAARCGTLNIGDQIISVNGISMVGLPITACQTQIKNAKHLTLVRLVVVPCPPVVEVLIKRPDTKYQLGFSVQDGIICSLLRGGIAERGGVRVGHRIIEINNQSVVATTHEKIVSILANSVGELRMKTMPTQMFRLLTGQETPNYI